MLPQSWKRPIFVLQPKIVFSLAQLLHFVSKEGKKSSSVCKERFLHILNVTHKACKQLRDTSYITMIMTLRGVLSYIMTKLFPQEISSHKNTIIMFKNLSQVTSDFHIPQGLFVVVVRVGYVSSSHVTFT